MTAEYPYGYCGMPCALCTRYRTEGSSRCPGCSRDGYYTDMCKAHHCCRDRALAHCGLCPEYVCARLGRMGDFRDLNTGNAKRRACDAVASEGFERWYADYAEKAALLTEALRKYNNGRMKRYLCELFLQHELPYLKRLMARAEAELASAPDKPKAFKALAQSGDSALTI